MEEEPSETPSPSETPTTLPEPTPTVTETVTLTPEPTTTCTTAAPCVVSPSEESATPVLVGFALVLMLLAAILAAQLRRP